MTHHNSKHGMYGTPTYNSWASMKQRCQYEKHSEYPRYGAKGIKVCDSWQRFEIFLEDMGVRPDGMTIDRKDSKGNYEPNNCRWATKLEQANNCSSNHLVAVNGVSRTLAQWAVVVGLPEGVINRRLRRGWSEFDAVFKPLGENVIPRVSATQFKPRLITYNGETRSLSEWALFLGFANASALGKRLAKGLPLDVALSPPFRKRSQTLK